MSVLEKKIGEFEQGERVEGFYLIKSFVCKVANNSNKKYLDIILADKTGEMSLSLRGKTHRMIKEMCAGNVILFHLFHFHHVSFYIVILIYTLKIL